LFLEWCDLHKNEIIAEEAAKNENTDIHVNPVITKDLVTEMA